MSNFVMLFYIEAYGQDSLALFSDLIEEKLKSAIFHLRESLPYYLSIGGVGEID